MRNPDRQRFLIALGLIAAPVALVVSEQLYTSTPDDVEAGLALVQAHQTSDLWAGLIGLLAAALFVPVVSTLATLPSDRGVRWARVGKVLGTLGVVGYAAHTGMFVVFGQAARQSDDRAAMGRLITAMDGNAEAGVVLLLFMAGLYLGLVVLMVGAARAGAVPWWSASCVIAAVVAAMVPATAAEYTAETLVILGLGGAAWAVGGAPRTSTVGAVESARLTTSR